ncbi:hypothetical protein ACFV20_32565 [Streptomyces sp. NPDC059696]|uniref:hypothetical protein n=1 Tax=Streptomyces sp. NPDC059696 TaxID=3346911 RepID=UPI0036A019FD
MIGSVEDVPFARPAMSAWSRGEAELWADAMSHALVEHYGRWATGRRWSHDEGDSDGRPVAPDLQGRLDACLAESADDARTPLPLAARAPRAYLDVCFFHPFDDGNARCVFLTLLFVLVREGIALDGVIPAAPCLLLGRRVPGRAHSGLAHRPPHHRDPAPCRLTRLSAW